MRGHGNKVDEVFEALRKAILDGEIMPGARLFEQEVANRMGVSRTPVREAFAKLVGLGILEPGGPGRGQLVTTPTTADVLDAYGLREVLEGLAASQAATRCGEVDALVLGELLQQLEEAFRQEDLRRAVELTWDLHRQIWELSGNRLLLTVMNDLSSVWGRLNPSTYHEQHRGEHALAEHRELVAAITGNRPVDAERIARHHIAEARATRIKLSVGRSRNTRRDA